MNNKVKNPKKVIKGLEMQKIDLLMWSKNGSRTLDPVLNKINKVIPKEVVHNKILVDDDSSDQTVDIATHHGWQVISNKGTGISDGANTGLDCVETKMFCSFEQDLLLANDWWDQISPLLNDKVVVASGIRLPDKPLAERKLQQFAMERYRTETAHKTSFLYGKTLDQTLYNTAILRKLGGFPKLKVNAGVDNLLAKIVNDAGLEWQVDFDVISTHLRRGLIDELHHYYWYGTCQKELNISLGERSDSFKSIFARTLFSPIRGLQVAHRMHYWQIGYVYPLIRTVTFLGAVKSYIH